MYVSMGFSIADRIKVFSSLALSKAEFISIVKSLLQHFSNILQYIQKEFMWDKSYPKINHSALTGDYYE